jgi:hypothetical protein
MSGADGVSPEVSEEQRRMSNVLQTERKEVEKEGEREVRREGQDEEEERGVSREGQDEERGVRREGEDKEDTSKVEGDKVVDRARGERKEVEGEMKEREKESGEEENISPLHNQRVTTSDSPEEPRVIQSPQPGGNHSNSEAITSSAATGNSRLVTDQHTPNSMLGGNSTRGKVDDISSLLSSMSIDEGNIMSPDPSSLSVPGEKDFTNLSNNPDPTHLSNNPDPTHLSNTPDPTHLSNNPDPIHLSNNPDPTCVFSNVKSTHFSDDSDTTHLSEDADSTHLSGASGHVHHLGVRDESGQPLTVLKSTQPGHANQPCSEELSGEGVLHGYVDELGNEMADFLGRGLQESSKDEVAHILETADVARKELRCNKVALTCEGGSFKPSSFSTPFRMGTSGRITDDLTGGGVRERSNFARLDAESANSKVSGHAELHSICSTPSSGKRSAMECDYSCTRLESWDKLVCSPMDVGTPGLVTPCVTLQPSAKKSILKKRRSHSDGGSPFLRNSTGRRNLSKSVTFKLPSDSCGSEGSVVLAEETPEHLWCTPLGWKERERAGSRQADELPCVCVEAFRIASEAIAIGEQSMDVSSVCSEIESNRCSCVPSDDMEHSTSTRAASDLLSSNHDDSIPSHDDIHDGVFSLYNHNSDDCDKGSYSYGGSNCSHSNGGSWRSSLPSIVTSVCDSQSSGLEGMSILAAETPVEFWESVPVNFINNTFSN